LPPAFAGFLLGLLPHNQVVLSSSLGSSPAVLTEVFRGSPQFLQANTGIVFQINTLMMGTGMVPETSVILSRLTRLIARDFMNLSGRQSFKSFLN
jgi:hypothetical protein